MNLINKEIEFQQVPPYECVPWFEENVKVGDEVHFMYNGGLGGVYPIEGIVEKIDCPDIYVNGKGWLMGDIGTFTKFKRCNMIIILSNDRGED